MKRILPVLICICLFLCACGNQPVETVPSTEATSAPTSQPTAAATTEAATQATTEATTEPQLYQHPLTGELLTQPWVGRATAVVMNNIRACLPQHGIGAADLLYEYETEGGITRMLAIYSDLDGIGSIGPVRSSRTFFNSTALSYGAPIVHCGGSVAGRNGHYSDEGIRIPDWEHIDEMYNGQYFFRDQTRLRAGFSLEHTLFTNGEKLTAALSANGYNVPNSTEMDYGLVFAEEEVSLGGESAGTVKVTFKGSKTTTMTYSADTGLYTAAQYGSTQVDGNDNSPVTYNNVLVLHTSQWHLDDKEYVRSYYDLVGSGEGYFACNGEIVPITWSRAELYAPFTFALKDGSSVLLAPGKTYVAFSGANSYISYE